MKKHEWDKMSVKELEAEVRRHNELYFVENNPQISDYEFDRLVDELRRKNPNSLLLSEITSDIRLTGAKVLHDTPMLSLDKCYDEKTLIDWAGKFEGDVVVSPKVDGCAVSLRYDGNGKLTQAATRGDGVEGEEITLNVYEIGEIPKNIGLRNVEVRGEIYMPLSVFKRYDKEFANPRNLAAGAIKQKDPKKTAEYTLSFWAYDLLNTDLSSEEEKRRSLAKEKFPVVEWKLISKDKMQQVFDSFLEKRDSYDFETDGVVYKANFSSEQVRLGNTAHHPRYSIAYKFQGESGTTILEEVEWSVARTGVITPVAVVEPVELSGVTVTHASLHNVGIMKKLGISKGAQVLMMRRGGVIPNVEAVVKAGTQVKTGTKIVVIPSNCPSCGTPTELRDDFLYCTNAKNCHASKVAELEHFIKEIGCDGFGKKLITKLYEAGLVTDPSEFYTLTKDDLLQLERMGDTLATKLIGNINDKRELTLDVFLRSLGIREVGKHVSKILGEYGSIENVMSLTEEKLAAIHTIGSVIAREVVEGLRQKEALIEKLLKHVKISQKEVTRKTGPLAGKKVLFTGTMLAMERKAAQALVKEAGGDAVDGVSKELDFLVVGDGGGAGSKLERVKKIISQGGKTKIVSETDFLTMVRR